MGCSSPSNADLASAIPSQHLARFQLVAQINHSLNVNKKYQHISKINLDRMVGVGYKRTYAYECLTTQQQLQKSRKQFWCKSLQILETRVNGSMQCWNAIKVALQQPDRYQNFKIDYEGRMILNRMKILLLNDSIQLCVDSKFHKYQVPIFCINQPISFSNISKNDKNLQLSYEDKQIDIKIRSTKFPNEDISIKQKLSVQVSVVKQTVKALKQLNPTTKIRLFYNGRQMHDDKALGNYSFQSGFIIQAMII